MDLTIQFTCPNCGEVYNKKYEATYVDPLSIEETECPLCFNKREAQVITLFASQLN